jgi:hypothetical protein
VPKLLDRLLRRPVETEFARGVFTPRNRRGALTAGAAVITAQEGSRLAKVSRSREWQRAAFGYARALPEVGFALRFLANNSTHVRLIVGDRRPGADEVDELNDAYGWLDEERTKPDPDALPEDLVAAAQQALDLLTGASPSGGGAAILAPLVRNLETVGEGYLVGRYDPTANGGRGAETWEIHSISEVKFEEGKLPGSPDYLPDGVTRFPRGYFRLVTGEGRTAESTNLDPTTTTVVRLWTADAEWSAEPDSPMRSLVGVCERLLLIERGDDAALRSRAAGNGVLLWPEELDSIPEDEDDEDSEFDRDFVTQLTTPLSLDGSAAQVVPMIQRGAYQYLDRVRHLTFGRPLDPVVHEREARLLARLGIGLDVPPEVITGLADTNHWNAWQITSDLFRHHQEPITIASVEGLSIGYLRARLTAAGAWDPELIRRLVIWYDASDLVAPADMSAAANDAYDRGLISDEGYRALRGIDEGYAPASDTDTGSDPVGETGLAPARLAQIATIARELLAAGYEPDAVSTALGISIAHTGLVPLNFRSPEALGEAGVPPISGDDPGGVPRPPSLPPGSEPAPEPAPETPPASPPPAPPEGPPPASAAPQATDDTRRLSRRLAQIDRTLRERIAAAADAAIARALERAGNRARAAAQRDPETREAVAGQPPENVLASLGQTVVAALGLEEQQLLAEAFGRLREQYATWTLDAAEEAIDAAAQIAGLDRSNPDVQRYVGNLRDRFADNVEVSWPTLESGLTDLASERLYDPNPNTPEVGELPAGAVPPGLIRAALAVAGGLDPAHDGSPPLSGLTSGHLLAGFLRDAGSEVAEYEWAYGISSRPFHPHRALDGLVFAGFDDPALSTIGTGGEWVGGSFAPGDHKAATVITCRSTPTDATPGRTWKRSAGPRTSSSTPTGRCRRGRRPSTPRCTATTGDARPRTARPPPRQRRPRASPRPRRRFRSRHAGRPREVAGRSRPSTRRGSRTSSRTSTCRACPRSSSTTSPRTSPSASTTRTRRGAAVGRPRSVPRLPEADEQLAAELSERFATDEEWQHAYGELERTLGRPGVTHERVGGHDMRTTPTRRAGRRRSTTCSSSSSSSLAEQAVKTSDVNAAGIAARGIGLRDLLTGDIRARVPVRLRRSYSNGSRRTGAITWTEFYYARTGSPAFAETRRPKHAERERLGSTVTAPTGSRRP